MVDCGAVAACHALLVHIEQETDDPLPGGTLIGTRASRVVGLLIIVAATAALVALTWFGTFTEAGWQRDEAEAHLEANVTSQATLFEDQVQRDLMELNQTLGVLGHAWEIDPSHFSLLKWRDLLVMTNTFSPDIYIANEHGVVRDDTVPEEVGRNVSDRDFFRALSERIYDDGKMFVGQSVVGEPVREWHMNLVRPLHHPDGSFAGIIGAALRLDSIAGFYRMANIGSHGVIAVVGLGQAKLRVAAGSNAPEPGSSIADTAMYKALETNPDGVWIGRTALDGVERVHAFHRIPDTDLAVVVGVDLSEAMAGAQARAIAAYVFAGVITVALLALAGILAVRAAVRPAAGGGARPRPGCAGNHQQRAGTGQGGDGQQDRPARGDACRHDRRRGHGRWRLPVGRVEPAFPRDRRRARQHAARRPADGGDRPGAGRGRPVRSGR